MALTFDDLLHRLWLPFDILLASFSMLMCDRVLNKCSDAFLIDFVRFPIKNASAVGLAASGLPSRFSCILVSLTQVRLRTAIPKVILISRFPSRFPCALVSLALVSLQVCCDPKTKKENVERLWILKAPRLDFGSTLVYFGILLGEPCSFPWSVAVSDSILH